MQTPQMATPMMSAPQAQFCGPDPMTSQSQAQIQNALNQQNALLHQNIQAQYMTHLHHLQQLQASQSSPHQPPPQPSSTTPSQANPPPSTPAQSPTPATPPPPTSTNAQDTSHPSPNANGFFEKVTQTVQDGFKAVAASNAERHHSQPPSSVHPQQTVPQRPPVAVPTTPHGITGPHQSYDSSRPDPPIQQLGAHAPAVHPPLPGSPRPPSMGLTIPVTSSSTSANFHFQRPTGHHSQSQSSG